MRDIQSREAADRRRVPHTERNRTPQDKVGIRGADVQTKEIGGEMEIKTALQGCDTYCSAFKIKQIDLYKNGDTYRREFRCEHIDQCLSLLEVLMKAKDTYTVHMDNIG